MIVNAGATHKNVIIIIIILNLIYSLSHSSDLYIDSIVIMILGSGMYKQIEAPIMGTFLNPSIE